MDLRASLLHSLFADVDENHRLTVLDVGPASPETVDFFAQFKCRLYFADLYSEDFLADSLLTEESDERSDTELHDKFVTAINCPAQTRFDICLLWDVLNYLDNRAVRAFTQALHPSLTAATRIHGFNTLKANSQLPNQQYSIVKIDQLKARPGRPPQALCFPRPQTELNDLLSGIAVAKATLLSNGLLEMLFKVSR